MTPLRGRLRPPPEPLLSCAGGDFGVALENFGYFDGLAEAPGGEGLAPADGVLVGRSAGFGGGGSAGVLLYSLAANLGGLPAIGGAEAAHASEEEAKLLKDIQSGAWVPADTMAFDKVIEPAQLRNEIIGALSL